MLKLNVCHYKRMKKNISFDLKKAFMLVRENNISMRKISSM